MKEKLINVEDSWSKFYELRNKRIAILYSIVNTYDKSNISADSLLLVIKQVKQLKNDSCSLSFVFGEYEVNREYLKLLKHENIDSLKVSKRIKINTEELNKLKDIYNENVKDYNTYIIRLPNNFIAKKGEYYQKEYFGITYGIYNRDPIKKREESFKMLKDFF
ncbi:LemA family protein [Apibacter raozihei]|uniref:LemA family protein n=1 Tax=Apibacter raozihei TaxID=2500547 RepID=UPI0013E32777|nr:LemA family protein [Apibacter raozihei]